MLIILMINYAYMHHALLKNFFAKFEKLNIFEIIKYCSNTLTLDTFPKTKRQMQLITIEANVAPNQCTPTRSELNVISPV